MPTPLLASLAPCLFIDAALKNGSILLIDPFFWT
jgi:hypothetical protein